MSQFFLFLLLQVVLFNVLTVVTCTVVFRTVDVTAAVCSDRNCCMLIVCYHVVVL